jgi:FtsP/CotA-like multicopper oxidase with cupredoxin domain
MTAADAAVYAAADTLAEKVEITLIEPNPDRLKRLLKPTDLQRVTLLEQKVQQTPLDLFASLNPDDLLFIDSSHRDDAVTQIGDVEEWTVRNVTGEHHVFHIHQTDFLVTESNGERIDIGKVMDTVNVPFARNGRPGEVKLIMPFLEDRIAGRFVYHCHILEHEDGGMMANINVQPRR